MPGSVRLDRTMQTMTPEDDRWVDTYTDKIDTSGVEHTDLAATKAIKEEVTRVVYGEREFAWVTYGGREMIALRPTQGQVAALARLGKSGRMDDIQRVANFLDMLEAFLADPEDKTWLSNVMLGGDMEMGVGTEDGSEPHITALGLLNTVARAFATDGDNREEKRAMKKARRAP